MLITLPPSQAQSWRDHTHEVTVTHHTPGVQGRSTGSMRVSIITSSSG
jgi:hypothetical protein